MSLIYKLIDLRTGQLVASSRDEDEIIRRAMAIYGRNTRLFEIEEVEEKNSSSLDTALRNAGRRVYSPPIFRRN